MNAEHEDSPMRRAEDAYRACQHRIDELTPAYLAGVGDKQEWARANAALGAAAREIFRLQEAAALARPAHDQNIAAELPPKVKPDAGGK